jgi:hypothetical protein
MLKEAGIVLLAALATLTVVAPEWTIDVGSGLKVFSHLFGEEAALTGSYKSSVQSIIDPAPTGYATERVKSIFNTLSKDYSIMLVASAWRVRFDCGPSVHCPSASEL